MAKVMVVKDAQWFCPICGHNKIKGVSAQVSVDGCEMWFECEKCGYDPAAECFEHVETVMGWNDELVPWALEIYRDRHPAGRAIYHEALLEIQKEQR